MKPEGREREIERRIERMHDRLEAGKEKNILDVRARRIVYRNRESKLWSVVIEE